MFVYQRKINNKDGIVFVSESVDQGKQLPIINGPVYAVYEVDGKIVAESVELVDGEIDSKSKYFYKLTAQQKESSEEWGVTIEPLSNDYTVSGTVAAYGDMYQGNSVTIQKEVELTGFYSVLPIVVDNSVDITARTSSGYDLEVILSQHDGDQEPIYAFITVGMYNTTGDTPEDFYDKEVDGKPATDVILTCGDSKVTATVVYEE